MQQQPSYCARTFVTVFHTTDSVLWVSNLVTARESSMMSQLVDEDVKVLLNSALSVAADTITTNRNIHEGLSHVLVKQERIEGEPLQKWLSHIEIPSSLKSFVLEGTLPPSQATGL